MDEVERQCGELGEACCLADMNTCEERTIAMRTLLLAVLLLVPSIGYPGTITLDGGNDELATGLYNMSTCSVCGAWGCSARFVGGSNGTYIHIASGTPCGFVWLLHYGAEHGKNTSIAEATSSGWREKRVTATSCGERIEWTVRMRVKLEGTFDCRNNHPLPYGDCAAYGWAEVELSGKASGRAETKGVLTASEGDATIGVGAGPVNLSAPFSLIDSAGPFSGNDLVISASGESEPADVDDRIVLSGSVVSRASTGDAAVKSEVTVRIIEDNFDLVFVP